MTTPLTSALRAAASAFGCSVADMENRHKALPAADARRAAYAILYRAGHTHYRVAKIAGRTPTATRKAFARHVDLMETDAQYRAAFELAERKFRGGGK